MIADINSGDYAVNMWKQDENQKFDVYGEITDPNNYKELASGLTEINAEIYRESLLGYRDRQIRKSTQSKARFAIFQESVEPKGKDELIFPIPMTKNGSMWITYLQNAQREDHPFGEHNKLATEILKVYFDLYNVDREEKEQLHVIEVIDNNFYATQINKIKINDEYADCMTNQIGQIQIPESIKQFFIGCGDITVSNFNPYCSKKIYYNTLCAREIITERNKFEELCNRLKSNIRE